MRKALIFLSLIIFLWSCTQEKKQTNTTQRDTLNVSMQDVLPVGKIDNQEVITIAEPITYDVIVKNPNQDDDWTEECLKNTDRQTLIKILFTKVINGQLKAHYYLTDTVIPTDSIKALYERIPLEKVGKVQFEEEWFFDTINNRMYKKVNSIVFGYELKDAAGEVYGYKPGFKVYLNTQ